ncbi:hypothetical protein B9Z19DRAFT_1127039 [Tuber borchii]|uniref:Uncharacterized protein n=1 Tax=Tuber borchii TaxID=42251 RepID=A0A2T6ZS30_TUBBO|nr:hypothetical protein B9Z19DRAFT_1127039 [Tuber borchii]
MVYDLVLRRWEKCSHILQDQPIVSARGRGVVGIANGRGLGDAGGYVTELARFDIITTLLLWCLLIFILFGL